MTGRIRAPPATELPWSGTSLEADGASTVEVPHLPEDT
jgi:hypothetical protein